MRKIIKWGIIISLSALAIWLWNKYRKCKKKGEESGKIYECNPFSSEPTILTPDEVRYKMLEGKCYEITDYGEKLSYRQVGLSQCGESEMRRSDTVEEAIYEEKII